MLTLIRGLPGSGKTRLAQQLKGTYDWHIEADQYPPYYREGVYTFDAQVQKEAHDWCKQRVQEGIDAGMNVIVANTFTRIWEMVPYIEMARLANMPVRIVTCERFGATPDLLARENTHGVPVDMIERMKARWETL